jgi:GntR family transcriptional regulator
MIAPSVSPTKPASKGSYVSKPKAHQSLDRLQGFAEAMSGGGNEIFNEVLSATERPVGPAVAPRLGLLVGAPVCEIKRLRFLNRPPISVDITYVPVEIGSRLIKADLVTRDIFLILENDFRLALGNAEVSIEAVAADDELARLLRTRRRAPLLRIERLTFTRDKTPLDFEYLFYIGDQFRYRLNVERRS